MLCWFGISPAAAQAPAGRAVGTYPLVDTVVTATRTETARADLAADISVVTRAELARMPASSVAEALQYVPGVYVEANGAPGSFSTARIRGSDFRHVAVYMDGVPLNQLANPLTDLSALALDNVERIEIVKGPASSAWGSALGGVVNIITRREGGKPLSAAAHLIAGEADTLKSGVSVRGRSGRFGAAVTGVHDESGGFFENSGYDRDNLHGSVVWDLSDTAAADLAVGWFDHDSDDPLPNYPDFWDAIRQRRFYQRLQVETQPTDRLTVIAEGRHHRFDSFIEDVYADRTEVYSDYEDEIWGATVRGSYRMGEDHLLAAGAEGDWGSYDWSGYAGDYDTADVAAWVNDTVGFGRLTLNLGARYDDSEEFGGVFSPSAGVVFRIPEADLRLRAQVARGFSAPPAAWLHDPVYGNPDLDPEIAWSYQVGADADLGGVAQAELALFRADVSDLIRYDFDTERFANVEEVTRQGVEASVGVTPLEDLSLFAAVSWVGVRDDRTDEKIPDIPELQIHLRAAYDWRATRHTLQGRWIDHNSSFPETEDRVFIFDYLLKAELPWPEGPVKAGLHFAVYNLLDTEYLYREVWPQPGRWAEAGVRLTY